MAYGYNYTPYQPGYPGGYMAPMPDQLAQLRQNQMQQQMQPAQTPAQPMQTQKQPDTGGIIWVQGEAGAKAYLVAPGNTVQLWDSENQTIYLKSADMSGMPSMRILDYTERTAVPKTAPVVPQAPQAEYVTIDKYNALVERLEALENKPCKCVEKKKAKEETDNG